MYPATEAIPFYYGAVAGVSVLSAGTLAQSLDVETIRRYGSNTLDVVACNDKMVTLMGGGIGGVVSRTLTAPLDRLKILAQEGRVKQFTQSHPSVQCRPRQRSDLELMVSMVRYLYGSDGMKGFWRGNGVNCLKAGPEFACAFTARSYYVQNLCKDPSRPSFLENAAVGAGGGATAQVMLYPLELTKQRMAAAKEGEYRSIADAVTQAVKQRGFKDLYAGLGANLAGIIPHRGFEMGMFFSMQQAATQSYGGDVALVPWFVTSLIGFVASIFAQAVTYPLNLARTRLQTQGVNGRPVMYTGLIDCISKVARKEGVRGLFAGILPNMLKAVPASMIMYSCFNETSKRMKMRKDRVHLEQQHLV